MEFCFAWCCMPPISHKTAWMREVPRPSLPTKRHYCFPGCQHDPGSLLLYSLGVYPKRSILLFFCCPSQSSSHLFLSKCFGNLKQASQKIAGEDKQIGSKPPVYKEETCLHWAADPLVPIWSCSKIRKSSPLAPGAVSIPKES